MDPAETGDDDKLLILSTISAHDHDHSFEYCSLNGAADATITRDLSFEHNDTSPNDAVAASKAANKRHRVEDVSSADSTPRQLIIDEDDDGFSRSLPTVPTAPKRRRIDIEATVSSLVEPAAPAKVIEISDSDDNDYDEDNSDVIITPGAGADVVIEITDSSEEEEDVVVSETASGTAVQNVHTTNALFEGANDVDVAASVLSRVQLVAVSTPAGHSEATEVENTNFVVAQPGDRGVSGVSIVSKIRMDSIAF